jgi:hypothetical protein
MDPPSPSVDESRGSISAPLNTHSERRPSTLSLQLLNHILSEIGAFSGAAGLVGLVGKVCGASDVHIAIVSATTIIILYLYVYREMIRRYVHSHWILIFAISFITTATIEKDVVINKLIDQSGITRATGIIEYVPHANDWLGNIGGYMDGSKQEIWLTGMSFYVTLPQFKDRIIKKLGDGVDVRFLIYDPLSPSLPQVAQAFGQRPEELASESRVTIENLRSIEEAWKHPTSSAKFEVRLFNGMPRCLPGVRQGALADSLLREANSKNGNAPATRVASMPADLPVTGPSGGEARTVGPLADLVTIAKGSGD